MYFAAILDYLNLMTKSTNIIEGYPNLQKVRDSVFENPGIKEWVNKRPKQQS